MNEKIIKFINSQTCASVCCVDEQGNPYCFSCFYAFSSDEGLLYFKSTSTARHSEILLKKGEIAGTILPDKLNILVVRGIQFEGIVLSENHPLTKKSSGFYHKKHPAALAMKGEIWTIQINSIKMTDSSMGFGKKINWNRADNLETIVSGN